MNRNNGTPLSELAHLRQSITDILSTPLGSRIMRRGYGSRLFDLVDAPMNKRGILDVVAATADALSAWEPRFSLASVTLGTPTAAGRMVIDVAGVYLVDGQAVMFNQVVN